MQSDEQKDIGPERHSSPEHRGFLVAMSAPEHETIDLSEKAAIVEEDEEICEIRGHAKNRTKARPTTI